MRVCYSHELEKREPGWGRGVERKKKTWVTSMPLRVTAAGPASLGDSNG